ncbi:DUF1788 domain-containing protein [Marinilactibacillus sp. Marseille-P9653]|uniref:DUF1788 domain-containing protein n=1 Tax=Marinilactibacillus sp. Marseille-P9653 TaxID=2866583 RepID=UPI001CE41DF8|nr:DUF1788 domain-containing protein [Marinilactibacillus sp. Marseille-P9653]
MRPVTERLEELKSRLLNKELLDNTKLGNEVGFFIFDHEPVDELIVRERIPLMIQELKLSNPNISIQVFDLYDLILEFFEKKNYLEKNFQIESRKNSEFLFQKMQQALRIATDQDWIVQSFDEKWDKESIVFITGVGKAFPLVRSHVLLNNLQPIIEKRPLILFYPGVYTNGQLHLFKEFLDDHYYRAFRAVES